MAAAAVVGLQCLRCPPPSPRNWAACGWLSQVQHTAVARHGVGWRHGQQTVPVAAAKDAGAPAPASLSTAAKPHGAPVRAAQQEHHAVHHGAAPAAAVSQQAAPGQQAPAPPQQQQQQQQQGRLHNTVAAGNSVASGASSAPAVPSAVKAIALAAAFSQAQLGGYLPLLVAVQQAASHQDLQQLLVTQGRWFGGAHVGLAWAKLGQLVPPTMLAAQLSLLQHRTPSQQQQQQGQVRSVGRLQQQQQDGDTHPHMPQQAKQTSAQASSRPKAQAPDSSTQAARALYRLVWQLLRLTQQQLSGLPPEGLAALLDYLPHLAPLRVARRVQQQLQQQLAERLQQVVAQRSFTPGQLLRCARGVAALGPGWAPGAVALASLTQAAVATKAGRGLSQAEALGLLAALVEWQAAVQVRELLGYRKASKQQQQQLNQTEQQRQRQSDGSPGEAGAHQEAAWGAAEPLMAGLVVAPTLAPAAVAQAGTSGCALGSGSALVPARAMAALVRAALPTLQTPPSRAGKRSAGKPGRASNHGMTSSDQQQAAGVAVVVLHACATLGYRPSPATLEAALVVVSQGWAHLSCHQLLAALLSLDGLGIQPWAEWLADCYAHLPGRLLGEQRLPRAVLLQLLVVLAEWEVPPPEQLLTAWCRAAVLQLPGMQLAQLQEVEALLASLWYQPPPFWQTAHRQAAAAAAEAQKAPGQCSIGGPHSSRSQSSHSRQQDKPSSSRSSHSRTSSISSSHSRPSSPGTAVRAVDSGAASVESSVSTSGLQHAQQEGQQEPQRLQQQPQRQQQKQHLPDGVMLAPEQCQPHAHVSVGVSNGHPVSPGPPAAAAAAAEAATCAM